VSEADQVLAHYPRIYFACHTRHVKDDRAGRVLSSHQASILDHLDTEDPTSLLELARHMGVTAGTMSVAVDRLVAHGYVLRARDANDRRRVNLRLSAAGARIREANSVLDPVRVRAMLARLPAPQRKTALHGLALLARAAQESMHEQAKRRKR
jgi:DNA-binding MarR family transcriptional regulator